MKKVKLSTKLKQIYVPGQYVHVALRKKDNEFPMYLGAAYCISNMTSRGFYEHALLTTIGKKCCTNPLTNEVDEVSLKILLDSKVDDYPICIRLVERDKGRKPIIYAIIYEEDIYDSDIEYLESVRNAYNILDNSFEYIVAKESVNNLREIEGEV